MVINIGPKPVGSRKAVKEWTDKLRAAEVAIQEHRAETKVVYVCRHSYDRHKCAAETNLTHDMYLPVRLREYVPVVLRVRTPLLDDPDGRVLWYSLFVDKYHRQNSQRDDSYNAVYMQVSNYNKTFRKLSRRLVTPNTPDSDSL
jgi:hypothetical protein